MALDVVTVITVMQGKQLDRKAKRANADTKLNISNNYATSTGAYATEDYWSTHDL
jgi:hypothetical protein